MSAWLTDEVVQRMRRRESPSSGVRLLAQEVRARRKAEADIRTLHAPGEPPTPPFEMTWCEAGCPDPWPCPTIRILDALHHVGYYEQPTTLDDSPEEGIPVVFVQRATRGRRPPPVPDVRRERGDRGARGAWPRL